jgi:HNH endonuclease
VLMRNGPYELVAAPADFPGKRYRDRYCYEHTLVWWLNTGRLPLPGHVIHHDNENKRDNRFENLKEKTNQAHTAEHTRERHPLITVPCGNCGSGFAIPAGRVMVRKRQSKSGLLFCGHACQAKFQKPAKKRIFPG